MRILIASQIWRETIEKLTMSHDVIFAINAKEEELNDKIKDCEVVVFRSGVHLSEEVMRSAPALRLIIRAGSGFDNIDLKYVQKKGLSFFRIPEPSAQAVAEMSFGFMLALAREILRADRLTRKGRWIKQELNGYLLSGKTLGVVGAGNIGSRVGRLGWSWGMTVIGCVKNPSPSRVAEQLRQNGIRLTTFDEVISTGDFVSIHVPLNTSTHYMFNSNVFSRMKQGAYLVNLARGGVVDEQALYEALTKSKILSGAALDVHEKEGEGHISPLADLSNVILTPHLGAQTVDSQRQIGERIIEIIDSCQGTCRSENEKEKKIAHSLS